MIIQILLTLIFFAFSVWLFIIVGKGDDEDTQRFGRFIRIFLILGWMVFGFVVGQGFGLKYIVNEHKSSYNVPTVLAPAGEVPTIAPIEGNSRPVRQDFSNELKKLDKEGF